MGFLPSRGEFPINNPFPYRQFLKPAYHCMPRNQLAARFRTGLAGNAQPDRGRFEDLFFQSQIDHSKNPLGIKNISLKTDGARIGALRTVEAGSRCRTLRAIHKPLRLRQLREAYIFCLNLNGRLQPLLPPGLNKRFDITTFQTQFSCPPTNPLESSIEFMIA